MIFNIYREKERVVCMTCLSAHMCVCMSVCMCIWYVCLSACVYVCLSVCVYDMFICPYVCIYVCLSVYMTWYVIYIICFKNHWKAEGYNCKIQRGEGSLKLEEERKETDTTEVRTVKAYLKLSKNISWSLTDRGW